MEITHSLDNKFSPNEVRRLQKEAGDFNVALGYSREPKTALGKDDFLKLLVVQMKHQDPLEPMKNTEAIAQMAQFSALEQMVKVGESMALMAKAGERVEAQSLLGKKVDYYSAMKEDIATGVVSEITYEGSGDARMVIGGETIMLKDISRIHSPAPLGLLEPKGVEAAAAYRSHQSSSTR